MRYVFTCIVVVSVFLNSFDAFARSKPKKVRDKDHPNYSRYQSDEEFRAGRSTRLTGILLSSIGGGTGAGAFIVGVLWNSCIGASGDVLATCRRNASTMMAAGVLVGGASLGVGIPMISVGAVKMGDARRRIDQEHPIKEDESNAKEGNEAFLNYGSAILASHPKHFYDDLGISLRVLNVEF